MLELKCVTVLFIYSFILYSKVVDFCKLLPYIFMPIYILERNLNKFHSNFTFHCEHLVVAQLIVNCFAFIARTLIVFYVQHCNDNGTKSNSPCPVSSILVTGHRNKRKSVVFYRKLNSFPRMTSSMVTKECT